MNKLDREFFARKPEVVAKKLLGKFLVRKKGNLYFVGKIVETEAYLGKNDKASHSHRGQTERNKIMFGPAGFSYVYFTYGMYWLLNFITENEKNPSGVLVRALEPMSGPNVDELKVGSGPAKLTKWMKIDGTLNNIDVTKSDELFVTDHLKLQELDLESENLPQKEIIAGPRIGINYAEEHQKLPLRFYIKGNRFVSKI